MLLRFLVIAILLAISASSTQAQQAQRWLVYKVRDGQLETRSHMLWLGDRPKEGVNIPANAAVREMPDTPLGARPHDFIRTTSSIRYEPKSKETPPTQDQIDAALAASKARRNIEAAAEDSNVTNAEFVELKNQYERAKAMSDPAKKKEAMDQVEVRKK